MAEWCWGLDDFGGSAGKLVPPSAIDDNDSGLNPEASSSKLALVRSSQLDSGFAKK